MSTLKLDPKTTALVLIDLQGGIVAYPLEPYSSTEVVERCATLAAAFRAQGAPVVYIRVDLANMLPTLVDRPMGDPSAPPPPAAASELVPGAGRQEGDLLVTKRHWDAFGGTNLAAQLQERGVQTVVIGGLTTNFGVESTARTAVSLGFAVVLAEDAMTSVQTAAHQFSVGMIFPMIGRVRSATEIAQALG